jgi:transposase
MMTAATLAGWRVLSADSPRDLTEEEWDLVGPFLSTLARRKDGPLRENRAVLNGVLWILRTAPRGPTCQTAICRTRRDIGAFRNVCGAAC